ncbi:hypothetical protein [Liquorilactobacillus hordei]|uniref:hypothetical protein n=1 Tax=Liquorilactobacillus hordei TaxID=468911 RepID=UPI001CC12E3E|nr:hypothetical protein [Liquorilactobacillus hordei]MBZ2405106.1 hypothetical protein [Liquorilactobacillus hordei]
MKLNLFFQRNQIFKTILLIIAIVSLFFFYFLNSQKMFLVISALSIITDILILQYEESKFFDNLISLSTSTKQSDIILSLYKDTRHIDFKYIATILLTFSAIFFSMLTLFIDSSIKLLSVNKHAKMNGLLNPLNSAIDCILFFVIILLAIDFIFSIVLYNGKIKKIYMKKLHLIDNKFTLYK